jgi:hypothetical protein
MRFIDDIFHVQKGVVRLSLNVRVVRDEVHNTWHATAIVEPSAVSKGVFVSAATADEIRLIKHFILPVVLALSTKPLVSSGGYSN